MMKNYVVLLGVLFLAACGKTEKADHFNDVQRDFPVTGELGENVRELLASEYTDECDQTNSLHMKELAYVLDGKVNEINDFIANQKSFAPSDESELVPFGKSFLKKAQEDLSAKDEWKMDGESWSDSYAYYQKIKKFPVNKYWIYLNSAVRSLISNDQMRILDGMNMDLIHDSGEKIESLIAVVQACQDDLNCKIPQFAESDLEFISKVGFYRYYQKKLEQTKDRDYLNRMLKRLTHDHLRFEFFVNATVKKSKSGIKTILTLPLEGSVFDQTQKDQVISYVEPVWSNDEISLKLEWADHVTEIFKMFFETDKPGERAYVSRQQREVHLFPLTRTRSIAHEFGHVLGFRDHYYTTFDYDQCEYQTEWNAGDLMSDTYGKVTLQEWKDLKKNYGQ